MGRQFRSCTLDQLFLLPPSIQDWLPEGHLARFIAEVAEELDLKAIYAVFDKKDGRGRPGYHPLMLTRLLLYGYCTGVRSSRQIWGAGQPAASLCVLLGFLPSFRKPATNHSL